MCVSEPLHLAKSHNIVKFALNPCFSHAQAGTIQVDIPLLHNIRQCPLHPPEIESATYEKRHGYKRGNNHDRSRCSFCSQQRPAEALDQPLPWG
jgi:hypothetical protein